MQIMFSTCFTDCTDTDVHQMGSNPRNTQAHESGGTEEQAFVQVNLKSLLFSKQAPIYSKLKKTLRTRKKKINWRSFI